MKKTITMLLALAGMACAAEPIITLDSETTHADLTNTTAAYIAAVMDMDTFATLVKNQTSDALVTFNLTAGPDTKQVGAGTVGNDIKGTHNKVGETISNYYTPNGDPFAGLKNKLDFNSLTGAVLTFAYDRGQGSRIILTTLNEEGVLTDYVGEIDGLKWASSQINGANIDAAYVSTANVYGGTWKDNMDELTATAHGLLVPEPATATLSLLALAGLAARRRRH